jgi:cbb3-type cytochrome oxidase subunit 3
MKFLKGLALFIFGSLLFLSLSVFGIVFTLHQTVLNPDFVISQVNRLDITSLAGDILTQQIPQGQEFMPEAVDATIADLEPWLKEQAASATYSIYDYFEGKSQSLSLVVSLEPLKESFKENLREAVLESPPLELAGLPPAEIESYLDEYYQQISQGIPSTFEFNETSIPPEVMAQFGPAKQIIGYFQLGFGALIGLILLLILLIIVITHQVRGSTRGLGTTFLICGALSYAVFWLAKNLIGAQLPQLNVPTYLQTWIPQLFSDTLAPLAMYSIGLMVMGVVLLIVSFAYRPRRPSF